MTDSVECYSGYEYANRPVAFLWEGDRIEVDEIIASWRLPNGKRFRVRSTGDGIFELQYDQLNDQWSIQQR